jgi:hypothetical protein
VVDELQVTATDCSSSGMESHLNTNTTGAFLSSDDNDNFFPLFEQDSELFRAFQKNDQLHRPRSAFANR